VLKQTRRTICAKQQPATLADAETRAILGGTCQCSKWKPAVNRDIAANRREQQKQIDGIAAQDSARIRG
jgi:hypothetical protein